jgi:hypothetical protein
MSTDAEARLVVTGESRRIEYALASNGSTPAKDFVESLNDADKAKLLALFERMARTGSVPNREQFKQVEGEIFEFKKHQMRVFCFRDRNTWFLTNGYKKKRDRLDPSEVRKAQRMMAEHKERISRTAKRGQR